MNRDPYKILGVAPLASDMEIKKAYRKKSKQYHPDLNPDLKLWSDEKMKELVEANELLSDPAQKKEYDSSPQFQLRRVRKKAGRTTRRAATDSLIVKDKPAFKESGSLLDRIRSIFNKPKKVQQKPANYNPKEADMHFALGISLCDNIKFIEQAPNEFKKAIQYDPTHIEAHYNLGIVYYKLGQFEEGIMCFQKILNIDKNDENSKIMIHLLREDKF